MPRRPVIDLRRHVDELGWLDPRAARQAVEALEWGTGDAGRINVLIRVPADRYTHPGRFLEDLAERIRCHPRVVFEGHGPTVREWEASYHRITAGVTLLDLCLFVDHTGHLDEQEVSDWLQSEFVHKRLAGARSVAVDLPEWRSLDPSPPVLRSLVRALARAEIVRGGRPLPVRFFGLSAAAWAAHRGSLTADLRPSR